MYGKLFASMYDGTLATHGPWQALVTFQQLVILADPEGVVDMTVESVARRTTIPLEIIEVGICSLEEPDPASRTPTEEGRRIVRLSESRPWGWRIVNYGFYRNIRNEIERRNKRREYHKEYARNRRKARQQSVNNSQQIQHSSTDVNGVTPSSKKETVRRTTNTEDPRTAVVLSRYKELHPDSRLSLKTASKVVRKAPEQYTAQELVEAVEGNAADSWHREQGKHELSYVLRNEEKIDQFREIKRRQLHPRLVGIGGEVTVEELEQMGIRL
jgi:hypothetical protein